MRTRTIGLILFGGFLLVLMLSLVAFGSQQAKADPPASGDWIINTAQTYTDKNFIVNGSLIVQDNGRLTLQNTTIRMNPGFDGQYSVQVEDGGVLLVRDRSAFKSFSGFNYGFMAYNNSQLEITKSAVYDAGWTWAGNGSTAGVFLDTTNVLIQNSTFSRDYNGIIINGRDMTIAGTKFFNITQTGLYVRGANVTVQDCSFKWSRTGMKVVNGQIDGMSISSVSNAYGVEAINSVLGFQASSLKYNYIDLYARNSTLTFTNSSLWSEDYEMFIVNGTVVDLINTTFNDQAIAFDDNSDTLNVWWFVRVHVTWQNGLTIPGANLKVTDFGDVVVTDVTVDNMGWSQTLVLEEYSLVSGPTGGQTFMTPHNFTAGLNGVFSTDFVSIAESSDIELLVFDLLTPYLNITFPAGSVAVNSMPYKINGTALDNGSGLQSVEVSAGSPDWIAVTGTTNWDYELNLTYDGTYLVQVRAVDLVGNTYSKGFYLTLDTMAPFLDIWGPSNGTLTSKPNVTVQGNVEHGATVTVNGFNTTRSNTTGMWSFVMPLSEGQNTILVVATDLVGNEVSTTIIVKRDSIAPSLQVAQPSEGLVSNVQSITVSGSTEITADVFIDDWGVQNFNGQFNTVYTLKPGPNTIHIRAQDAAGNIAEVIINVTYDNVSPFIIIATPYDGFKTNVNSVMIKGLTESGAIVIIGGFPATNIDGVFNKTLTLKDGVNFIIIKSTDAAGNEATATINITFDNVAPALSIDFPTNNMDTSASNVTVKGSVDDATRLFINGKEYDLSKLVNKQYSVTLPLSVGANPIIVRAEDDVGNVNEKSVNINRAKGKTTNEPKPLMSRLFDFNDPIGLIFLLAIIIMIVGCVVAGVMAARAPSSGPPRPRGPPQDRDGPGQYRGGPPPGRRPPPRRPDYRPGPGGPPPRRPGYQPRPPAYTAPAYTPEPEPPAPPVPEPAPVVYAPQPEPVVEEPEPAPAPPKVVEYEPEPTLMAEEPEPGIPEIPSEEPPQEGHDALEASIANILTTLDTKAEEPSTGSEVVPMSLPLEIKDDIPSKSKDVLAEITCPSCHADIKSTWATCPFCDYNLKGGAKPTTKAEQPKDEPKDDDTKSMEPEPPAPAPKAEPKTKTALPTKAVDAEVIPQDIEDVQEAPKPQSAPKETPKPQSAPKETPKPQSAPKETPKSQPAPKEEPKPPEPPMPQKPAKDKNLDDILKKLKLG